MKITDVRCATIGDYPIIRIVTDEGIDGYSQVEFYKPYVKDQIPFYRRMLVDKNPTEVERVMRNIRRLGAFKPWGSAVSAIEVALWDIAGKAAGVPIHRLLGGKIRDRVRVYNSGGITYPNAKALKSGAEGFTLAKYSAGYHGQGLSRLPDHLYGEWEPYQVNNGVKLSDPINSKN